MIFFILPIVVVLLLYFIGNIFSLKFNLNAYEKPIYGLGLIIILTNYCYFNLDLTLQSCLILIYLLLSIGLLISFLDIRKNIKELLLILKSIFILQVLFTLLASFYGEQFYIFRGNAHDHFAYLTSGQMFNSYSLQEILTMVKETKILKDGPINAGYFGNNVYLGNSLHIFESRPSVQLMLGYLMSLEFLNPIKIGFIFKSITSCLILLSSITFFRSFTNNERLSLFISYGFIFSIFNFYNYEIDAYALILSTPFLFLILKYSFNLIKHTQNFNSNFYFMYILIWACYFIIYPNGAAILMVPIFTYILFNLFKHKINFSKILKLFLFLILFLIIILPTFDTTIKYLYVSEIPNGLKPNHDYWGYFGAFILGKDNPIHDYVVISQIKELWHSGAKINEIVSTIFKVNIQNDNYFFILNIIPSIFGMFHFSTSGIYGSLNYILAIFLLIINFIFIKTILYNLCVLFKSKDEFYILFKYFLIYFAIFFTYLIFNLKFWPAIKLYFVLSPLFFILISFTFNEKKHPISKNYIIFLLMLLPFYKYTEFNHGIGRLDSFPSIIKKENKTSINWNVDSKKLSKCDILNLRTLNKFEKNYISLIYSKKNNSANNNKTVKCKIELINNNFKINEIL